MTVGFLALRKGFLKVMGALIQTALDRGHEVVLLWDPVEPKSGERLTRAELAAWPGARIVVYDRHTALLPALHAAGFTPRQLHPSEERALLTCGCGVTNLVNRATVAADELNPELGSEKATTRA